MLAGIETPGGLGFSEEGTIRCQIKLLKLAYLQRAVLLLAGIETPGMVDPVKKALPNASENR